MSISIVEAIKDKKLFRPFLANRKDSLRSWRAWLVALRVLYGLPIKGSYSRKLIRQCTGRDPRKLPKDGFQSAIFLTGRRSGKSRISAVIGAYEGVLSGSYKKLAPGETGLVPVITPTLRQGRNVQGYLRALFDNPMFREQLVSDTKTGFDTKHNVRVEVLSQDQRTVRGYSMLGVVLDEACFLGMEGENKWTDTELVRALQPALITTGGKLIAISSPYAKRGWVFTTFEKHYGDDKSNVLVWRAPSKMMNPTLPQRFIDAAMKEDMAAARSEYFAEWREDVGLLVAREVIEGLVVADRIENLPRGEHRYFAFVDISGGRGDDSALAIAHKEGRKVILDFAKVYKAPHSPQEVIGAMAEEMRRFRVSKVTGDAYGAEFCSTAFGSHFIYYTKAEKNKSGLYAELLPILCSRDVELLDHPMLVNQLASLERRTRSGGKDVIDHPRGKKDDLANAVAGVIVVASKPATRIGYGGY